MNSIGPSVKHTQTILPREPVEEFPESIFDRHGCVIESQFDLIKRHFQNASIDPEIIAQDLINGYRNGHLRYLADNIDNFFGTISNGQVEDALRDKGFHLAIVDDGSGTKSAELGILSEPESARRVMVERALPQICKDVVGVICSYDDHHYPFKFSVENIDFLTKVLNYGSPEEKNKLIAALAYQNAIPYLNGLLMGCFHFGYIRLNLSTLDLSHLNLKGVNFDSVDLMDVNFSHAVLSRAIFRDARVARANFTGADLSGVNLSVLLAHGAAIRSTTLRRANLTKAILQGLNFSGMDLTGTILKGADLRGAQLCKVDLSHKALTGRLDGADLTGAKLTGATASWSTLQRVKIDGKPWSLTGKFPGSAIKLTPLKPVASK